MGQRRVSETLVGTTEAGEVLDMSAANVAKNLSRGLELGVREVDVLIDPDSGDVLAQKMLVGRRSQWGYSRDYVERVKRERDADVVGREADDRRRKSARQGPGAA